MKSNKPAIVGLVVVAIVVLFALLFGGNNAPDTDNTSADGTSASASADSSAGGSSEASSSDVAVVPFDPSILVVKTTTVDCIALVKEAGGKVDEANRFVIPDPGAVKGVPPRQWSDSISTPLVATDAELARKEVKTAICQDPILGLTTANMLANLVVAGYNVGELNADWLLPYAGDAAQIQPWADQIIITTQEWESGVFPSDADLLKINKGYNVLAEKLGTLLDRFANEGIQQTPQSVLNYHLAAGGLVVGPLPVVELNPVQENLPALVLSVTQKDVCGNIGSIGFNTGDKRPELFAPNDCAPVAPPADVPVQPEVPANPGNPNPPAGPTGPGNPPPPATTTPHQPPPVTTSTPPTSTSTPPTSTTTTTTTTTTTSTGGKQHTEAPVPDAPIVTCNAGQHLDRNTNKCVADAPPPPAPTTSNTAATQGQGDSGVGATNTVAPPSTNSPAATVPNTVAPTTNEESE